MVTFIEPAGSYREGGGLSTDTKKGCSDPALLGSVSRGISNDINQTHRVCSKPMELAGRNKQ